MNKIISLFKRNREVSNNIFWLFGDHAITFLGGFFISIWLAKHLGPANFGIYGFAVALLSIMASFSQLGLSGIAVKELVESKNQALSISTIAWIKLFGSALGYGGLLLYLYMGDISITKFLMASIIGISVFFNPFTVIDNYFDSKVLSKYKVIARKTGYIFKSVLIIVFIIFDLPLIFLAYLMLSEKILAVLILMYFYKKQVSVISFGFSKKKAKMLLTESWPLIISGVGAILYLKLDQIMVVSMVSDTAGGQYAAAVRYTSIFYFIQTIIMTTFFPSLISKKNENESSYYNAIKKLSTTLIYLSFSIIIGTYIFIEPFIHYTFGIDYVSSIDIIKYHIWSLPLVFLGAILSKWLILEKLTRYSIVRHGMGLIANIMLNMMLIPIYGAVGAAIASIVAMFFSVIVVLLFNSKLRLLGKLFFDSLIPANL